MRSPRKAYQERIRRLSVEEADRFVDVACQFRVYRRGPDGNAVACEWLPQIFGGKYDRLSKQYVGPPARENVRELKIHSGQLATVGAIGSDVRNVVALGAQGGGKTEGLMAVATALSAMRCNGLGLVTAPIADQTKKPWEKFLARVAAFGWVEGEPSKGEGQIRLKNGTVVTFRGVARQSNDSTTPIAGLDAHWVCADEQSYYADAQMREVHARLRIARHAQVFSSATNEPIHEFQQRLLRYEADPHSLIVRYPGTDNCFTPIEHWEAMKAEMSPDDYDRYINCKDVPIAGRVYPTFQYKENKRPLPATGDVTARITQDRYGAPYDFIVGLDPGSMTTASVILKAFAAGGPDERNWFAIDEVTTRDATTEFHARDLKKWFMSRGIDISRVLVLADPHENKEADRSDLIQMRAAGFATKPSNGGDVIERKHRISMVNALLLDATGRRRLFLCPSANGALQPEKLSMSLGQLRYLNNGEIDFRHKNKWNQAHWSDALGYGLFPFERMRGSGSSLGIQKPKAMPIPWRHRGS